MVICCQKCFLPKGYTNSDSDGLRAITSSSSGGYRVLLQGNYKVCKTSTVFLSNSNEQSDTKLKENTPF
ncbi:hypothetical protein PRBEI_2000393800 [Prionailurus iriomotensis]